MESEIEMKIRYKFDLSADEMMDVLLMLEGQIAMEMNDVLCYKDSNTTKFNIRYKIIKAKIKRLISIKHKFNKAQIIVKNQKV